ncbi:unnamed protein product [Rotaria sp. Silwood2]|nr:unnamed protein product [Rotaria sp. Silwood2]
MEENLLNELENFTSIKYLDDLTNNNNNNNCCNDDDQDSSLVHQLAIKDRQLILAAKCGKVLLEEKDELERQIELINRDYQQRIDVLEQERHELRLLIEQVQSECDTKIIETNEDKCELRRQLSDLRREQRIHGEQQTQTIQELTEINHKLTQDLQISRTNESRLQEQLRVLRQQADTARQTNTEQIQELSKIKQQLDNLHCQYIQLQLDHHLLLDEHDTIVHKLDECQRKYISIEDECRSLQDMKFQNEKELNDAHDLIHRLSQYNPENRAATSFMQELQDDFGVCPDGNARFNSTIIDDDDHDHDDDDDNNNIEEHEDCHMDDDNGVEISQTPNTSSINEKCLLDEFLQTEEFKREIVLVYKQLRSLCLELIYIHTHTYSTNMSTSSSISDTVDKVYDRLKNGCLISILFELKNLIKDMIEHEDMIVYKDENNILPNNTNTILPSPSITTINSYTSAYDDVNLLTVPSTPELAELYNILQKKNLVEHKIFIDSTSNSHADMERDEWLSTMWFLPQSTHSLLENQNANETYFQRLSKLINQCAVQDCQQVNLTSSLPKNLITCHAALTNNNTHLISCSKLSHLEYIQRNQYLIIFSKSRLFTESSKMIILLAIDDLRHTKNFIEYQPYIESKQIFSYYSYRIF